MGGGADVHSTHYYLGGGVLGSVITWVEVLTYPVVITIWVHYYLGGSADVLGVPGTHQIRPSKDPLYLRVAREALADFQTGAYPVFMITWVHCYLVEGGGRGSSRQFSNQGGRTQWSIFLGSIMTWL